MKQLHSAFFNAAVVHPGSEGCHRGSRSIVDQDAKLLLLFQQQDRAAATGIDGVVAAGIPAKFLRDMEQGEADFVLQSANNYAALASVHAAENSKTTEEILVSSCRHIMTMQCAQGHAQTHADVCCAAVGQ